MKIICISASNILKSKDQSTSFKICKVISKIFEEKSITSRIIDLREYNLSPCIGCGKCFETRSGAEWALKSYKAMVNDTIANALDTIQCKLVPYSEEWDTGISLPVENVQEEESIFPIQSYNWIKIEKKLRSYVENFLKDY